MASDGVRLLDVLCGVCDTVVVEKRVFCKSCKKWMHVSCLMIEDKVCCPYQDPDRAAVEVPDREGHKRELTELNQAFESVIFKLDDEVKELRRQLLFRDSVQRNDQRLKEINEDLQYEVEELENEMEELHKKLEECELAQNNKTQPDVDNLRQTVSTMFRTIMTQFDKNYVQITQAILDMRDNFIRESQSGFSQKNYTRGKNQGGKSGSTVATMKSSNSGKNTLDIRNDGNNKKQNKDKSVNCNIAPEPKTTDEKGAKPKTKLIRASPGDPEKAFGQENFKCPDDFGFYPHHSSCDKYWKCDNNVAELKTCGNGLAFDASDPKFLTENCDYIHNVDCGDRTQLEPPISTSHCERLYGIFADENKCDVFWNCWNGEASRYQCSPGLAYDREARVCMWADQVPECKNDEVAGGFSCPAPGEVSNTGTFSRHAHPDDCRKYYICLEGTPREYGCPIGTVFKIGDADGTGNCEDPEDVPGCEDYYGDLDLKSIRKSELLAGLQSSGSTRAAPGKSKPRPAPASRNAPEPADN